MTPSLGSMVQQLSGLVGTKDVSDWEDEFIGSIVERTSNGARTSHLTEKQVEQVERIYRNHFA